MRILFLSDNFPPEVNAPASRTFEHCREWVQSGHEVCVLTGVPNFPAGRIFSGYRNRLWQSETRDGIRVVRVWTLVAANQGVLLRTLDYMSFMISSFLASLLLPKPDVVVGTSPQFFTAIAAWAAAALRGVPFVFELRDLWPESIKAVGAMRDSWALRMLERLELFLYHRAAAVVCVTHSFHRRLIARGIPAHKLRVVTNGADLERFRPMRKDTVLAERLGLSNKFVTGYIGTHGMAHCLETLLEAAKILQDRNEDRIHFLFLGDGSRKAALKKRAKELALRNLKFLDTVPKESVRRYWALLDVAIIHLKRSPLFKTVLPSKLFESMAMGIPIALGVGGESAALVERESSGRIFPPEDSEALADLLSQLSQNESLRVDLGAAARAAATRYDRRRLAAEMAAVLASVLVTPAMPKPRKEPVLQ